MKQYTDTELLDFLQGLTDRKVYTGKVILRNSVTGRGWRLHETSGAGVEQPRNNVRQAIIDFMEKT
ncbi:MAG: hypothetical protein ABIC57_02115 [bacterium]